MILPAPHRRFPSAALLGLALTLLLAGGCQKAQPQHQLSLSYDFWYDQLEWSLVDLEGATILDRRFHDRQGLLLGQHEYTRQSDGETYGNEYVANLTWEALKVQSPERARPIWIITHLECELEINYYMVGRHGEQTPVGSIAHRAYEPVIGYALSNPDHEELRWSVQMDIFHSTSDQPTLYVDLADSSREGLSQLSRYEGVKFETASYEILKIHTRSNGLAFAWADDVVSNNLYINISPLGGIAMHSSEPELMFTRLNYSGSMPAMPNQFLLGHQIRAVEVEIIDGTGTAD